MDPVLPIVWQWHPKSDQQKESTRAKEERQTDQFIKDKTRQLDSLPTADSQTAGGNIAAFEQIFGNLVTYHTPLGTPYSLPHFQ